MDWKMMVAREPELQGIERACRAARQQGATWYDFQVEHHGQIAILAGRMPTPGLRLEAMRIIDDHLMRVWNSALDAGTGTSRVPVEPPDACLELGTGRGIVRPVAIFRRDGSFIKARPHRLPYSLPPPERRFKPERRHPARG